MTFLHILPNFNPLRTLEVTLFGLLFSAIRGVARIFQRGGGHIVSNIIVMAFSPRNIIGCFIKKSLTKGGSRAPKDPLATPLTIYGCHYLTLFQGLVAD